MRALQTKHDHSFFPTRVWNEKSTRDPSGPRRESHSVPVLANPEANDRLDSWKEIASYLKRTVRTVQRWERHEGLPVHRHFHQHVNSVYARKSELDEWWNREPQTLGIEPLRVRAEGSRRQVTSPQVLTLIHSEEECHELDPGPLEWLIECVQQPREARICSPQERTGQVVFVLRVRIRNGEYLLKRGPEMMTRDAKARVAPCRLLLPLGWPSFPI